MLAILGGCAILFAVMRDQTQAQIRKQSGKIDGIVGALQVLAETNLIGKGSYSRASHPTRGKA